MTASAVEKGSGKAEKRKVRQHRARGGGFVRELQCVERYTHGAEDSLNRPDAPKTGDGGALAQCEEIRIL